VAGGGKEGVYIRRAREDDLAEIAGLEAVCFPSPWPASMYGEELDRDVGVFLAAVDAGRVVGYVCGWSVLEDGHVLKIAVARDARRRGIGRRLMAALEAEFIDRGAEFAWLEARESNDEAVGFYRSLGFVEVGRRRRYYSDTGEDALILIRFLGEVD